MRKVDISVIVPVYGVERFVGRCMESLMNQTLREGVEYIIVDDCSPDDSMSIIKEVVDRSPGTDVRIIRHETNKGLPAARNTGLRHARGEYIYHCDSDDFLEPDALGSLLRAAVATGADYMWCDWFLSFGSRERAMRQPEATSPRAAVRDMLAGVMKYNVWNKLVRRSLYEDNKISFPDGQPMGEDMTMILLAARSSKVAYVGRPLYHYVKGNVSAMSRMYDGKKTRQLRYNADRVVEYVGNVITDTDIAAELDWFKLNVKLPFLFTGSRGDMERWLEWYPESNASVMRNRNQSLRVRLLQWTAAHGLTAVNTFYTLLLNKLYYGIIYR